MNKDNQEKLARQWAENYRDNNGKLQSPKLAHAAADYILATTTKPTMADVDWDHDKHYLAGAVDAHGLEVIMHSRVDDCEIATIRPGDETHGGRNWDTDLIPNGKRYELVEVTDEPEHPEVLRTVEDYKNAPEGTVVDICGTVAIRQRYGWCVTGYRYKLGNDEMFQQGEGVAVRWGE